MSQTKTITIPETVVKKLLNISKKFKKLNTGNAEKEFWLATTGDGGGYDWEQFDIGINEKSELITGYQSGCSCNGPEAPSGDKTYSLKGEIVLDVDDIYDTDPKEILDELLTTTDTLYDVLNKKTVDTQRVIGLSNAEIRRSVIEYIGMEKFIKNANPELLDDNEKHGQLLRIKLPEDEDLVLLHVKDASTTREYFLRVPPEMKTAAQARGWTFGFKEEDFNPTKET